MPCSVCSQFVDINDRQATATSSSVTCGSCSTGVPKSQPTQSAVQKRISKQVNGNSQRASQQQPHSLGQQRMSRQPNSPVQQRMGNQRASGFAKVEPSQKARSGSVASPTRTRTMSVSNHRSSRTMAIESQQQGQVRSSRSQQGATFMPSICGQQGFLARRKDHGSWDRFWVVLNGKNLIFYSAPGVCACFVLIYVSYCCFLREMNWNHSIYHQTAR